MKKNQIIISSVVALFLSACAHGPDVKMLEKRANYDAEGSEEVEFGVSASDQKLVPKRTATQTTDIFIYPHEMGTGDYFLGAWIRSIVIEPRWAVEKPSSSAPASGLLDVSSGEDLQKELDEKHEQQRRRVENRGQK